MKIEVYTDYGLHARIESDFVNKLRPLVSEYTSMFCFRLDFERFISGDEDKLIIDGCCTLLKVGK